MQPLNKALPVLDATLTIILPAFNEEGAIAGVLDNVLAARPLLLSETPLTDVSVIVVDDGSTDATRAIADKYTGVTVLSFERNRGYGAAIKAGFAAARGSLVAFMDADGTLDAADFVPMVEALYHEDADLVVGGRLADGTRMSALRIVGNRMFIRLLGFMSNRDPLDCASGMRVLKRSSLKLLMPLPDGLNFTPAMSSMALLDQRIKIAEVPVTYRDRIGSSKLRLLKDGLRFLGVILLVACFYNPLKCAACVMLCTWALGLSAYALGWPPVWIFCTVAGIDAMIVLAALTSHHTVKSLVLQEGERSKLEEYLYRLTNPAALAAGGAVLLASAAAAILVVSAELLPRLRFLEAVTLFALFGATVLLLLALNIMMVRLMRVKLEALADDPYGRPSEGADS